MGVDKYSDVLDSEVAECDFTDVYMRSISHPSKIAESLYPVEAEMKQQPSTPPPPSSDSLAALTMASTFIFVMSFLTI